MAAVCRSVTFHFRSILRIRRSLTPPATKQVLHAFVISRHDFDNALVHRLNLMHATVSESAELSISVYSI